MRIFVLLSLTTLLLFSSFSISLCKDSAATAGNDDDEDLSFLEDPDETSASHHQYHGHYPDPDQIDDDTVDDADLEDFSGFDETEFNPDAYKEPEVDDKDVVVLKDKNFSDVVKNNRFVMVEFYAPWCGHCQALAPEYAAAATELKGENVILAKVDATEENELAQEYDIQGFPTVYFFIDGVHKPYNGQRTK